MRSGPPRRCPNCGAEDSFTARYTTGGGWRASRYVCEQCGGVVDARSSEP